ncbi:hypothetical protein QQF64_015516 [Cirrhinus molitorella]|uniref:Delta-like protein n=1 Tax=Cirrhinus molitorella TaxID=172907 RepID=A0ABR3NV67_9TELE
MSQFLSAYFLVLISVQVVKPSAVFELKVHSFTTTSSSVCQQSRDCQVFFRVCLNYTQDVVSYRLACSNGTGLTEILSTDRSSISTSAPITVPFNLKWLGTVALTVIIEAWNAESSNDHPTENLNNMIGHFATRINLTIGQEWFQDGHLGEQSELRFCYRIVCDKFYYGDDCSDFCRSRDDPFGHFTCDDTANRICLPQWKGEFCAEPICLSGCSEEHGYCEAPGQCKCLLGWQGPRCDECVPYPGCIHGTCVQSSGVFELKVHSFTNTSSSVCQQSRDCQVFFHVCLNYTQDDISYRLACSNGIGVTVTFSTDQSFTSTCAPITVPFNLKRLTTVSVIIKAWDAKSSNDHPTENLNNISHFATNLNKNYWSEMVPACAFRRTK